MEWFGFWIFIAVWVYVDHAMYLKGHDGWWFEHKTPEEKRLRDAVVRKAEIEAGIPAPIYKEY